MKQLKLTYLTIIQYMQNLESDCGWSFEFGIWIFTIRIDITNNQF